MDPITGRRTRRFITVRGNKKEAEKELTRVLNEVDKGTFVDPSKLTVGEYLDMWLRYYAAVKVAPKT